MTHMDLKKPYVHENLICTRNPTPPPWLVPKAIFAVCIDAGMNAWPLPHKTKKLARFHGACSPKALGFLEKKTCGYTTIMDNQLGSL